MTLYFLCCMFKLYGEQGLLQLVCLIFNVPIGEITFSVYSFFHPKQIFSRRPFFMQTWGDRADDMLTRTGTVVRKNRRRSSGRGSCRRGSAPTVLQAGCVPPSSPRRTLSTTRTYLTPQPSPSKSVTFSFEGERKSCYSPDVLSMRRPVSYYFSS